MKFSEINGYVDGVLANAVVGWARNPHAPEQPTEVVIVLDDKVVGRTLANEERPDLANIGLEDGKHGFTWPIPRRLSDGNEHVFSVFSLHDRKALLNSPVRFRDESIPSPAEAGLSAELWLDYMKDEGVFVRLSALRPGDVVAYLYITILGRMPEPSALTGGMRALTTGETTAEKMATEMVNSDERRANRMLQTPSLAQVSQIIDDYTNVFAKHFRKEVASGAQLRRS